MFKNIDFQKWKTKLVYLICFLFFLGGSFAIYKSYSNEDATLSSEELFKERLVLIASTVFFTGCGILIYFFENENNKVNRFISKHSDTIIIKGSDTKNSVLFFGCSLFVMICFPLTFYPNSFGNDRYYEKIIIGGMGLVFFGIGLIVSLLKLFKNNSSLVITTTGFTINSGVLKSKIFLWKEIKSINEIVIKNNKFININLYNPKEYIKNQKYWINRKLYSIFYATSNTLISITSSNFDIGHDQLLELLKYKLEEFKKKK